MAQPEMDNRTPFAAEAHFAVDEDGRPLVVPIVKATYHADSRGTVSLAEEQAPVDFVGQSYGEPGKSSMRFEPDVAFAKPSTDCILLGHAQPSHIRATRVDVTFRAGKLEKTVRVTGDRHVVGGIGAGFSPPELVQDTPLTWERAFGGWDRTAAREDQHTYEPRNPVGVGFVSRHGRILEGAPLPNLEDPQDPLREPGGRCRPAGLGFVSPDWQPRASFGGTYDEEWMGSRGPLLPRDFHRRFFNSAPEGLTAADYFLGDEWIQVLGATPEGNWIFQLPGLESPRCRICTRFSGEVELSTRLDTVIVDADEKRVILTWRAHTVLRDGPLDVIAMVVECANAPRAETPGVVHPPTA